MAHVLLGSANAVAAPEAVFSLRAAGHRLSAFGPESARAALKGLPVERYFGLPDPGDDAAGAVAALEAALAGADPPDAILPLDDAALWLLNATPSLAARSAGAVGPAAELALDKGRQLAAAKSAGLAVLPTVTVANGRDLAAAVGTVAFPAILKPRAAMRLAGAGLTRGRVHYLQSAAEAEALARDTETGGGEVFEEPLLLQPLIGGTGEGVFGFAGPRGVTAWSGHRRVRMLNPHGSGSSACRAIAPEPALCEAAERFVMAAGWRGPFMIELLRDPSGTPWFMELNGRLWGSLALARRQGLEYPAMAVAGVLDPDYDPGEVVAQPWPHVQRHLGRDLLHLLHVARGPKSAFHKTEWPGLADAARTVLRPAPRATFYNYDPSAPGFFLADAFRTVRRALRR